PLIPKLHEAGFAVLALDMRGHGESVQPATMRLRERVAQRDPALFNDMYQDVAAAYVWLAGKPNVDPSQFGLVGASVGCSVALDYATRDKSVDAVVCLTPGEKYLGVDSVEDIKAVGRRAMLLLTTEGERADSDSLAKLNPGAEVRVVGKGVVHGTNMFGKMAGIEDQIVAFLNAHVRSGGEKPVAASLHGHEYFAVGSAEDIKLDPKERRLFSSLEEARARGLTGPDSPSEGKMIDTQEDRTDRGGVP
ncbi:MAG: alpha/beta fold hydrolase, partial [Planctomycetota bacterium]